MTTSLGLIIAIIPAAFALMFFILWKSEEKKSKKFKAEETEIENKLSALRDEVQKAKASLTEKTKQLDELKETQRKKAKREGKKLHREQATQIDAHSDEVPELAEKRMEAAIAAVEAQMKEQAKAATAQLAALQSEHKEGTQELVSANKILKKELEQARKDLKDAKEFRPDVPGAEIDLEALPQDALKELAFQYSKGEEFRKLYRVSRGQQRLLQDQIKELRVKYLSVCRELALVVGAKEQGSETDKDVVAAADAILDAAKNNTTVFAEHQIAAQEASGETPAS